MESPLKQGNSKEPVTFYEICMEGDTPLLGSITGECSDLREELKAIERRQQGQKFDAKVRRKDLEKLLRDSKESHDEWVTVRLNFTPPRSQH